MNKLLLILIGVALLCAVIYLGYPAEAGEQPVMELPPTEVIQPDQGEVAEAQINDSPKELNQDSQLRNEIVPAPATQSKFEPIPGKVVIRVKDKDGNPVPNVNLRRFLYQPKWNRETAKDWVFPTDEKNGEVIVSRQFLQPVSTIPDAKANQGRLELMICSDVSATLPLPSEKVKEGLLEFTITPEAWLVLSIKPDPRIYEGSCGFSVWAQKQLQDENQQSRFRGVLNTPSRIPVPVGANLQATAWWQNEQSQARCIRVDIPPLKAGQIYEQQLSLRFEQWLELPVRLEDGSPYVGRNNVWIVPVEQSGMRIKNQRSSMHITSEGIGRFRSTGQWSNTNVYVEIWGAGPDGQHLEGWTYIPPLDTEDEVFTLKPITLKPVEEQLLCSGVLHYSEQKKPGNLDAWVGSETVAERADYRLVTSPDLESFQVFIRKDEMHMWQDQKTFLAFYGNGIEYGDLVPVSFGDQNMIVELKNQQ